MRKYVALLVVMGLALALASCGGSTTTTTAPPAAVTTSTPAGAPTAEAVWTETLASESYKSWQTAPGMETPQPAKGPHGKQVQVFVDPSVSATLAGPAATAWPVGSMIVKDALDDSGALVGVEYMQKTDQGWYFASFDPTGKVAAEGVMVEPCQSCHAKGSDGVFSAKLPS
ncbi:MAG: cytochrome P460 family protein [Thermoleophilia bacterium]|jgi:hypothetical protein|nr:cytochrome P460 family protein [Thermoleophilia bacterium]